MKHKKTTILGMFLIILLCLSFFYSVFASSLAESLFTGGSMSAVQEGEKDMKTDGGIGKVINIVIGILQLAGTGISVIMIAVLGIKYLLASVEEKAEIKKTAMPILIGAVLLFGAVQIIGIVEEFSNKTINTD